jgi:hypothetical protein
VSALPNHTSSCQSNANSTPPGNPYFNRPYAPQVSMYFDDKGTSGTSTSISTMVTMNADITLTAGQPHVIINTLRFHNLSLDFGQNGTSFKYKPLIFGIGDVPRLYIYLDSQNAPFVMNDVQYPPSIDHMRMGTDSQPATALRRFVWEPGSVKNGTFALCGVNEKVDTKARGTLACGGQKELTASGINAFNLPVFGDILNICGTSNIG